MLEENLADMRAFLIGIIQGINEQKIADMESNKKVIASMGTYYSTTSSKNRPANSLAACTHLFRRLYWGLFGKRFLGEVK